MLQQPASAMKLMRAEALQILQLTASFRAIMLGITSTGSRDDCGGRNKTKALCFEYEAQLLRTAWSL